eukprot:TRINITY_DN20845_c0_g2_i1.p1 TRINITY_DN20845_c0_g2~~TRINITY_DN20845_c0_g2_i1.p1  ORF type:complete len:216 (+),score=50.29 TRINITY_DN20845_c0_g2_i1:90-650(+)
MVTAAALRRGLLGALLAVLPQLALAAKHRRVRMPSPSSGQEQSQEEALRLLCESGWDNAVCNDPAAMAALIAGRTVQQRDASAGGADAPPGAQPTQPQAAGGRRADGGGSTAGDDVSARSRPGALSDATSEIAGGQYALAATALVTVLAAALSARRSPSSPPHPACTGQGHPRWRGEDEELPLLPT